MPSPHPGGVVLYVDFSWRLIRAGVRATCFWIERPKGNGSDNNLLQKIRNQVKHAHEQSGPSARENASSRSAASNARKSPRKNFPRFKPRNPLKSLESDEEIQDNSTLMTGGLQSEIATSQENPNDRPDQGRDSSPGRSQTESIQMQSGLGRANRRVKCASRKAQLFWQPVRGCPPAPQAFRRVRARALPSR
jgi:hypothetical protein